jgi:hypothetical protein
VAEVFRGPKLSFQLRPPRAGGCTRAVILHVRAEDEIFGHVECAAVRATAASQRSCSPANMEALPRADPSNGAVRLAHPWRRTVQRSEGMPDAALARGSTSIDQIEPETTWIWRKGTAPRPRGKSSCRQAGRTSSNPTCLRRTRSPRPRLGTIRSRTSRRSNRPRETVPGPVFLRRAHWLARRSPH